MIQTIRKRVIASSPQLCRTIGTRPLPGCSRKTRAVTDLEPKDQLVYQWQQPRDYSASLANHPDRFYQLLKAAQHG